jgi:DNA gyrase subunit A
MATNIPPHNLGEVIDACIALINDPALGIDDLINIVPGPDFPTGGIILGRQGIRAAYHLGRGSIVMRGKVEIEDVRKDRQAIVVSEIPYQVNKAGMVERIAELVREKKIEGIADLRDESDRDGYRVVVELKRDVVPEVVLNQLYKFTPLQTNFGANMVAGWRPSAGDEPEDLLTVFIAFRENVVSRRTKFLLKAAIARIFGRSCHRRCQYRRSHPRHPHVSRSEHRARNPDVARLAGQGHGDDDHADRRSASPGVRRWHCAPVAGAGESDP